jgi:hypothetical protein
MEVNDKYLFTTTDCMGNNVALKTLTYTNKISNDHPEITPELIRSAVECAHLVSQDKMPNRYDYYRIIPNPIEGKKDLIYIKAVVETTKLEYNEIVTTFIKRKMTDEANGGIIYDAGSR